MTSPSVHQPPVGAAPASPADDQGGPADADGAGDPLGGAAVASSARISLRAGLPRPDRVRPTPSACHALGARTGPRGRDNGARSVGGVVLPVDIVDVRAAAARLSGVARRTRVVAAPELTRDPGSPVWFKCEHEQHTGSFKLRGAYNRIAAAGPRARARGVVAASAGNHAQGVAFAAARFGAEATIFVPRGANPAKVARTRGLGARVEEVPGDVDAAIRAATAFAAVSGGFLVHPFDDEAVVAGQGTTGLELLEQIPDLSTVITGVGGGGLLCGLAVAIRSQRPDVHVIGVQAAAAPAFAASFRAGSPLTVPPGGAAFGAGSSAGAGHERPPAGTVADGMAVGVPGRLTLALAARLVDDVVTVDEDAFWEAMVLLRRAGHRVEPAGAAGVAALLRMPWLAAGPTAVILSGGNLDPAVDRRVAELAAATRAG